LIHTYTEHPIPRIRCVAQYKRSAESESLLNLEIPVPGNPHAELVLSQEKAVVSDDVLTEPLLANARDLVAQIGLKSMIAIRTSYQGKANGAIALHQYDRPRHSSGGTTGNRDRSSQSSRTRKTAANSTPKERIESSSSPKTCPVRQLEI